MAKRKLDFEKAKDLIEKTCGKDERCVVRAEAVANFAYDLAKKVKDKKKMNIDPERVRLAALLHDIGKKDGKYDEHPFIGARMLYDMGHPEIARIIETHGDAVEVAKLYRIKGSYHPKTVEQKIVTYADFRIDLQGKQVSLNKRLAELKKHALSKMEISRIRRYEQTEQRLRKIDEEVKAMLR